MVTIDYEAQCDEGFAYKKLQDKFTDNKMWHRKVKIFKQIHANQMIKTYSQNLFEFFFKKLVQISSTKIMYKVKQFMVSSKVR